MIMEKRMIGMIRDDLVALDYEKRLRIEEFPMPMHFWVKPMEEGRSRPRNPTFYLINTEMEYYGFSPETFAAIVVSRAVHCRRQHASDKIETFCDVVVSRNFSEMIKPLVFNTWGKYQANAEIVARIGGNMFESGYSLEEISRMILMKASDIKEKYGVKFLEESMYIVTT